MTPAVIEDLRFDAAGLIPAVVQQYDTHEVLMVGWMDAEAVRRTSTSGRTTFWSRSRQQYWVKGETAGIASTSSRCWWTATRTPCWCWWTRRSPACHTGTRSCFEHGQIEVTGP